MGRRTRQEARHIILDAAEEVIAAKGVLFARPADVAEQADYSTGNLYTDFHSWNDLLEGVLDRACAQVLSSLVDHTAQEIVVRCTHDVSRSAVAIGALLVAGPSRSWEGTESSRRLRDKLAQSFTSELGLDAVRADLAARRTRDLLIGLRLSDPPLELSGADAQRLCEWVATTTRP